MEHIPLFFFSFLHCVTRFRAQSPLARARQWFRASACYGMGHYERPRTWNIFIIRESSSRQCGSTAVSCWLNFTGEFLHRAGFQVPAEQGSPRQTTKPAWFAHSSRHLTDFSLTAPHDKAYLGLVSLEQVCGVLRSLQCFRHTLTYSFPACGLPSYPHCVFEQLGPCKHKHLNTPTPTLRDTWPLPHGLLGKCFSSKGSCQDS